MAQSILMPKLSVHTLLFKFPTYSSFHVFESHLSLGHSIANMCQLQLEIAYVLAESPPGNKVFGF
nr:hypothetical protein [Nostoc sp. DedQUE02]